MDAVQHLVHAVAVTNGLMETAPHNCLDVPFASVRIHINTYESRMYIYDTNMFRYVHKKLFLD